MKMLNVVKVLLTFTTYKIRSWSTILSHYDTRRPLEMSRIWLHPNSISRIESRTRTTCPQAVILELLDAFTFVQSTFHFERVIGTFQPACICGSCMDCIWATWVPSGHGPNMGIIYGAHLGQLSISHMGKNKWAPYMGPICVIYGK